VLDPEKLVPDLIRDEYPKKLAVETVRMSDE
jgi:hypothetical protein